MDPPAFRYHGCHVRMGHQGIADTHVTCMSSALTRGMMLHLTSFINTSSTINLLRILRWWHQSIKPTMGPFLAWGPMHLPRSHTCAVGFACSAWEEGSCWDFMEVVALETMNEGEGGDTRLVIPGNGVGKDRVGWRTNLVPWVWIFQTQKRESQGWEWVLRHHGLWDQKTMIVNPAMVTQMVQNVGCDLPSLICFSICLWGGDSLPCRVMVGN